MLSDLDSDTEALFKKCAESAIKLSLNITNVVMNNMKAKLAHINNPGAIPYAATWKIPNINPDITTASTCEAIWNANPNIGISTPKASNNRKATKANLFSMIPKLLSKAGLKA